MRAPNPGAAGQSMETPMRIPDAANPAALHFAQQRLQNAENAGVIAHQHLPTDALGLISLYHALSPQIAHAVNQGQTLQPPYAHPLPAPQAYSPTASGGSAHAAGYTPLPLHVSGMPPGGAEAPGANGLDALLQALGHAPRGAAY